MPGLGAPARGGEDDDDRDDPTPGGDVDPELDLVVGLRTDAPLRRAIMPDGGLKVVQDGLAAHGYELPEHVLTTG
ncbi:hypothetical protein [Kineococcus arenarius]|uniref:hypothetical protein n=1 Tax=unclassified Kineococcus TaxID=2621656 RepID=UPI003D7C64D5